MYTSRFVPTYARRAVAVMKLADVRLVPVNT